MESANQNSVYEKFRFLSKQNLPFIKNRANKMKNAVLSYEDCEQELLLCMYNFLLKNPEYLELPDEDLSRAVRRVLHNFTVNTIVFYSRRPDTSLYKDSISSELEAILPDSSRADKSFVESNFFSEVIKRLEIKEKKYPGVLAFFYEAINPSDETLDKYEEYKATKSKLRFMTESSNSIPPGVLAKITGVSPRRLLTFQLVICKIIGSLDSKSAQKQYAKMTNQQVEECFPKFSLN